ISRSINDALYIRNCKLSAETLNEIFRTLPDVKGQTEGAKKIWIADNPGTDACDKKIATDKGWELDVEDTPPPAGNSMTMTTTKAVGEKIELRIEAEPADRPNVWIDLNNNKVKDAGESVTRFNSYEEYKLGSQTVTVYGKVTVLTCPVNSLTSLDVSKNTALTGLVCYSNSLTSLDVSKNIALKVLNCDSNSLTSLDVSKNTALTYLDCHKNSLTSLDVSKNKALTGLYCYKNSLTSLDVSKNTALTYLNCSYNKFTSLDVSKNTALTELGCSYNSLTSLDVSKNKALKILTCDSNKFTSLDVSKNTALTIFSCSNNPNLSSLKISSSINDALLVNDCKLSTETLNEIFRTLPDVKGETEGKKKIWIGGNPGTDACNKKIATDKGWTVNID
ncbi:hypothetical protein, partial [Porphyromonas sp. COT-108 OH1349]|uniref:leucine-rich repeat domain-containing protein n=1 Tax=Porphyromonas sp. COT-108 OH1349 TaxID=1537504 RepID=UPI000690EF78